MKRKEKIVLAFLMVGALAFVIIMQWTKMKVEKSVSNGNGLTNDIMLGTTYIVTAVVGYFFLLNLTSLIGLLISWRRGDTEGTKAFQMLTLLSMVVTVIYFITYH